jgi:hypothetical protein
MGKFATSWERKRRSNPAFLLALDRFRWSPPSGAQARDPVARNDGLWGYFIAS